MNTTPEALKQLYVALGGETANVSDVSTNVEALKYIYTQLGGSEDVSEITTIPDIIEAIAQLEITIPSGTKTITENGTHDVAAFETAEVNVPSLVPTGTMIKYTAQNRTTGKTIIIGNSLAVKDNKIVAVAGVTATAGNDVEFYGPYSTSEYISPLVFVQLEISTVPSASYKPTVTGNGASVTVYSETFNNYRYIGVFKVSASGSGTHTIKIEDPS